MKRMAQIVLSQASAQTPRVEKHIEAATEVLKSLEKMITDSRNIKSDAQAERQIDQMTKRQQIAVRRLGAVLEALHGGAEPTLTSAPATVTVAQPKVAAAPATVAPTAAPLIAPPAAPAKAATPASSSELQITEAVAKQAAANLKEQTELNWEVREDKAYPGNYKVVFDVPNISKIAQKQFLQRLQDDGITLVPEFNPPKEVAFSALAVKAIANKNFSHPEIELQQAANAAELLRQVTKAEWKLTSDEGKFKIELDGEKIIDRAKNHQQAVEIFESDLSKNNVCAPDLVMGETKGGKHLIQEAEYTNPLAIAELAKAAEKKGITGPLPDDRSSVRLR